MNLSNGSLYQLLKYSAVSGLFSFLSFIMMSMIFYSTTPIVEKFVHYFDSGNVLAWFLVTFNDVESVVMYSTLIICTFVASTLGVFSAVIAKTYHEKASDIVSSNQDS